MGSGSALRRKSPRLTKHFLLGAAFTCCLLMGLSACGGSSSTSGGLSSAASKNIEGTITVWDPLDKTYPGYTTAVKPLDEAFERANPKVTVEHIAQPLENYPAVLRTAFSSHEGPDVMGLFPGVLSLFQWIPGLEELNSRITPEMNEQLFNWEITSPTLTNEGPRYGVPIGSTGVCFYYNKKLFKKAGLPTDFKPKSWNDLKAAAEKLKAAGIQPFVGGDEEGIEDDWWLFVSWPTVNTKQQAIELGKGELPFTDESVTKAFGPEMMMQEAGLLDPHRFTTSLLTEAATNFSEEKGAMILGGTTSAVYWAEFVPKLGEKNLGVFFAPGSKFIEKAPELVWSIPKFAKNKEAAWAYLEFMASKEAVEILDEKGGLLPARKDVPLPASFPSQPRQIAKEQAEMDTFTSFVYLIPEAANYVVYREAPEMFQGRTTVQDVQKAMQEAAEKAGG